MLIKRITNIISILIIIISLLLTIFIKNEITRIIFSSIFTGFLASLIFNIPLLLSIKFKEIKQLYNSLYEIKSNCSFLRNDITDFIENNKTISKEDFESYRKIVLSNNEIIKNIDNYLYFNRHKKNCLHQFKWELIDRINFINALINNVYSKISNINLNKLKNNNPCMTYAHELEKDLICIEESCVLCENLCDVFIDKLFNSKYKNDWDRLNRSLLNNNLTSKTKTI